MYYNNYFGNKTVSNFYEKLLTPMYLLNLDSYQKAIDTQTHLMETAKLDRDKIAAANSVLQHLKAPDFTVEDDIKELAQSGVDAIQELKNASMGLVAQQKDAIKTGVITLEQVAESKIINNDEK